MKKTNIIYGCLIFVFLVAMCSCSARKVNKQSSKEETKTEVVDNSTTETKTESNVKTETLIKVDDKNETVTEETTYKPEDPTKESFIIEKDGTKVVLNNSSKIYKKTTQKNNAKIELLEKFEELKKEASKEQKSIKQVNTSKKENSSKQVEKEAFNWFQLLWLLLPAFIIYWAWRKYKQLTLFPKL